MPLPASDPRSSPYDCIRGWHRQQVCGAAARDHAYPRRATAPCPQGGRRLPPVLVSWERLLPRSAMADRTLVRALPGEHLAEEIALVPARTLGCIADQLADARVQARHARGVAVLDRL